MRWAAAIAILLISLPARAERASCYGPESGTRTASGERFDWRAMTAASRTLAFNTWARVTFQGRSVTVRVTDRGPAKWTHRDIDLSNGACARIGLLGPGSGPVTIEIVGAPYTPKHGDWNF